RLRRPARSAGRPADRDRYAPYGCGAVRHRDPGARPPCEPSFPRGRVPRRRRCSATIPTSRYARQGVPMIRLGEGIRVSTRPRPAEKASRPAATTRVRATSRTAAPDGRPVQARLLSAASTLFAERGFAQTSVQDIVERAGVTKGAMYHYYSAKDEL